MYSSLSSITITEPLSVFLKFSCVLSVCCVSLSLDCYGRCLVCSFSLCAKVLISFIMSDLRGIFGVGMKVRQDIFFSNG